MTCPKQFSLIATVETRRHWAQLFSPFATHPSRDARCSSVRACAGWAEEAADEEKGGRGRTVPTERVFHLKYLAAVTPTSFAASDAATTIQLPARGGNALTREWSPPATPFSLSFVLRACVHECDYTNCPLGWRR
ncbi:hypothetical protein MRX96_026208 [Rhipicephalus microplus]